MTKIMTAGGHPVRVDAMHPDIRTCECRECAGRGPASRVYTREELDRIAVEQGGYVGPYKGLYYEPHGGLNPFFFREVLQLHLPIRCAMSMPCLKA